MSTTSKPRVLIVGGGLGGLMLGGLLERSGVPYAIFERVAKAKPVGAGMLIGPGILPTFQQLGIYDDFLAIGKKLYCTQNYKESLEKYRPTDTKPIEAFTGYLHYVVARSALHDLLLKLVPADKIHFGKRVLNITEKDDIVSVQTSDNGVYEGEIVVGADGAYSAVRQRLYEKLKSEDALPSEDNEELPFSCTCLVGQTRPLDPKEFPIVDVPDSQFLTVYGHNKPFTWSVLSTSDKRLCWFVTNQLSKQASKEAAQQRFRNNENSCWGDIPALSMRDETRDFVLELNDGKKRTMGDLYDLTPKENTSKVMFEEKVFKTWYHRRFVLIGDGAIAAMHDAMALANLIYAMPTKTSQDITRIFEEYKSERYPAAIDCYKSSKMLGKIIESGFAGAFSLFLMTKMPQWMWRLVLASTVKFRPQIGFLERVAIKGTVKPVPSPSEKKARAVFEKQQQRAQNITVAV
ncbi:hypothetical protein EC957_005621 [Mortierella hygrophila]|uniref:FAD-binding domain-containing protein n=1 Tax=Mortierella hygrophila TaxID=979708 RepID=A0A9P6EZ25_9FUNG|nr:hypothetical protein EC957_005621 [Mortierella hygrophila]